MACILGLSQKGDDGVTARGGGAAELNALLVVLQAHCALLLRLAQASRVA